MKRLLAAAGAALLGVLVLVQVAPSASRDVNTHTTARDARLTAEAHAAFIKDMSAHPSAVRRGKWRSPGPLHSGAQTANGSVAALATVNWSGFADSATAPGTFSRVSGSWTIPAVTCLPSPYKYQDAFIADWVGLDGVTDQTVEQLGTGTQCFEGVTYYYVWYEMYPAGTVEEGTTACIQNNVDCPQPGDRISASVTVTAGGTYTLSLTDFTHPVNNFSVTAQCATGVCEDTSAEWVIERPAVFIEQTIPQILPLVDFDKTGFTNGFETANGVTSSILGFSGTVYDVLMTDDTDTYYLDCVGQTGPPESLLTVSPNQCPTASPVNGNSFSATWDASF